MRFSRYWLAVIALVVAGVAVTFIRPITTRAQKGIAWRYDYNAAAKEAATTKKPLMVDFYADWCGWCKKLDRDVYTDPKVIKASKDFVALKLNTDKDSSTARKYQVRGLPTVAFLKSDTKEVSRVVGYRPASEFLKEMNKAADAAKK